MLHESHNPNKNLIKEAYTLKVSSRGGWNSGAAPSNMSINDVTITSNNYDFIKGKIYYDKSEFAVKFDCKRPSTMEIIENGTGSISNQISGSKYTADASLTSFIKQKCVKPSGNQTPTNEGITISQTVNLEDATSSTGNEMKIFKGTKLNVYFRKDNTPYLRTPGLTSIQFVGTFDGIPIPGSEKNKGYLFYDCKGKFYSKSNTDKTMASQKEGLKYYDENKKIVNTLNDKCRSSKPVTKTETDVNSGTKDGGKTTEKTDQQNLPQVDGNKTETNTQTNTETGTNQVELIDFIVPVFPGTSTKVTDNQQGEQPTVF